jgi:prolyl 4-hydroxylase
VLGAGVQDMGAKLLPEHCADERPDDCATWAGAGECEKNAPFMTGDGFALGACRRSCGECEDCAAGDDACASRNRVRAGYLPLSDL